MGILFWVWVTVCVVCFGVTRLEFGFGVWVVWIGGLLLFIVVVVVLFCCWFVVGSVGYCLLFRVAGFVVWV